MSSELERRLEGLLLEAPEPDSPAEERALERALRALAPRRRRERRPLRIALVLVAAALALLALAAGSLAAAGALHVTFGHAKKHTSHPPQALTLPAGADGIAAVVDGRLSVVTRSGFRLQGLPVTAATLSPHALYVAAGIGNTLVAMRPNGSQAWSHATDGRVAAISWAPDGIRIAYIVRARRGLVLHVIWANGSHDAVIDRFVRSVTPSWRADSLALAYAGVGGRAVLYDLAHGTRSVVAGSPGGVFEVSFAPSGTRLAVLARHRALLGETHMGPTRTSFAGVGWFGRSTVVLTHSGSFRPAQSVGKVVSFATSGKTFATVVDGGRRVVAGTPHHFKTVLSLARASRVESVFVR